MLRYRDCAVTAALALALAGLLTVSCTSSDSGGSEVFVSTLNEDEVEETLARLESLLDPLAVATFGYRTEVDTTLPENTNYGCKFGGMSIRSSEVIMFFCGFPGTVARMILQGRFKFSGNDVRPLDFVIRTIGAGVTVVGLKIVADYDVLKDELTGTIDLYGGAFEIEAEEEGENLGLSFDTEDDSRRARCIFDGTSLNTENVTEVFIAACGF